MYQSTVLIISSEPEASKGLKHFLERMGFKAIASKNEVEAKKELQAKIDLIISDIRINESRENEFLGRIIKGSPLTPVILLSYFNEIRKAAQWVKKGVFTYTFHPIEPKEIWLYINEALGEDKIVRTVYETMASPISFFTAEKNPLAAKKQYRFVDSTASKNVRELTQIFAPKSLNVMLYGEDGTGKSRLAKTIHSHSKKVKDAFIQINCSILSIEEEWKSFLDVVEQNRYGGTLFFNQISSLSINNQKNVLKFLKENNLPNAVGETPFRIITADNTLLLQHVLTGHFNEDLFHILNQAAIQLPSLRLDVGGLLFYIDIFIKEANRKFNKSIEGLTSSAKKVIKAHFWPGNLRELKIVIYRAVLNSVSQILEPQNIQTEITECLVLNKMDLETETLNLKEAAERAEVDVILRVLKQTRQNKSKTALILGIDRKTLYNKMAAYQLLD